MDFTALMRQYHFTRQNMLFGIMLGDDTGQQITLRRDHFTVFVGILVEQRHVALLNQTANFLVQASAHFTFDVAVVAIFDIGACQFFIRPGHQLVFYRILNFVNIDARLVLQIFSDNARNLPAILRAVDASGNGGALHRLFDQNFIERDLATIPLDDDGLHFRGTSGNGSESVCLHNDTPFERIPRPTRPAGLLCGFCVKSLYIGLGVYYTHYI